MNLLQTLRRISPGTSRESRRSRSRRSQPIIACESLEARTLMTVLQISGSTLNIGITTSGVGGDFPAEVVTINGATKQYIANSTSALTGINIVTTGGSSLVKITGTLSSVPVSVSLKDGTGTVDTYGDSGSVTVVGGNSADVLNITQEIFGSDVETYEIAPSTVSTTISTSTGFDSLGNITYSKLGSLNIVGGNTNNTYNVDGTPSGTAVAITGGSGNDTFILGPSGGITAKINGGGGTNTLEAFNTAKTPSTWSITAKNAGTVNSVKFSNIENLGGGTGADTFVIESGGSVTGTVNGGAGANTLLYFVQTTVDLQTHTATDTGGFANIQTFIGPVNSSNTFVGPNAASTWSITAANEGTVDNEDTGGLIAFVGFGNLTGGTAMDAFVFGAGGGVTGKINGGGGGDWLDYAAYTKAVTVNLSLDTATGTGGIANIQNVRGGQGTDKLTGNSQGNILIGGAGTNTITGGTGRSILIGGTGKDTVTGGSKSDILIGGSTSYDSSGLENDIALEAILKEWQSGDSYSTRISKITSGVGNGNAELVWGYTVLDNAKSEANTLTGAGGTGGLNWFFANTAHTTTNKTTTETLN